MNAEQVRSFLSNRVFTLDEAYWDKTSFACSKILYAFDRREPSLLEEAVNWGIPKSNLTLEACANLVFEVCNGDKNAFPIFWFSAEVLDGVETLVADIRSGDSAYLHQLNLRRLRMPDEADITTRYSGFISSDLSVMMLFSDDEKFQIELAYVDMRKDRVLEMLGRGEG